MPSYNLNSGYGKAIATGLHSIVPTFGRVHVVVDSDDAGEEKYDRLEQLFRPDPAGQLRFYTSLEAAYSAATSNNNDIILLDGDGTHTIANQLTWSKSRIHVIGMDGGDRLVQQGSKVATTDAVGDAAVVKVTGTRNSFRNIKFIQSDTDAAALHVLEEGAEGSLYKNCSFVFGVVDNLDQTNAYEVLCGSDSSTFLNCMFGLDTLLTSAARTVFRIDQVTASQEFKSNILKDCTFLISSSSSSAQFISMAAAGDILFTNHFDSCNFIASVDSAGGAALTKAVSSANGTVKGILAFSYPKTHNCTNFGVNGTNNDAITVIGPLVSNTDLVGVPPIAT